MSLNSPFANVLGVRLDATNLDKASRVLIESAETGIRGYVCVTGVHGVTEAQNDVAFLRILNTSFLNVPDGMPMSWVGWAQGHHQMDRVYGPDLMLEISKLSVEKGLTHFYYGGKEGVADLLAEKMRGRFSGLNIVGTYCPPFRPLTAGEKVDLQTRISKLKPDFFWIGLSTPKQEACAAEFCKLLDAKIFLAVGAAFDFHADLVSQAPRWMQRAGLEWLYRLFTEPRRLWKRYLVNNPLFIFRIFCQLTGLKKYHLEDL
jgi:N-acetylglucosaminyldiphosphoundecaprenol N-acetyl-beta-D-mannosaminyltransferase